jgi:hypothetical protein
VGRVRGVGESAASRGRATRKMPGVRGPSPRRCQIAASLVAVSATRKLDGEIHVSPGGFALLPPIYSPSRATFASWPRGGAGYGRRRVAGPPATPGVAPGEGRNLLYTLSQRSGGTLHV